MKCALITGITGQDGSYLAEFLLEKGYRVVGGVADPSTASGRLLPNLLGRVELVSWDMRDEQGIADAIRSVGPSEIYNFAAYSTGTGMFDVPVAQCDVNGLAVLRILEGIRNVDPSIRFCQASSREVFGEAQESPQTESTPRVPRSPYGAAKLFGDSIIQVYRNHYGLFCCSALLFNHESPRRSPSFVTRKITTSVAKIKLGRMNRLRLGNLDAVRDWGFAGDYVRAMWLMLQREQPEDFVICTGEGHTVRELCRIAFAHVGLDYLEHVDEDKSSFRVAEPYPLIGLPDKAKRLLGWVPEVGFEGLIRMMVDSDLARERISQSDPA